MTGSSRAALALAVFAAAVQPAATLGAGQSNTIQSFSGGNGWLNGAPLTPAQLQGKIVLVDFWEYTCINCLRTLPYLREWYRRYRDRGFVIVGVHTPEFNFSGERANVAAAAKRLGVTWPIVLDDNATIWKRYANNVWPRELLYDRSGKLVEDVSGEGGYPETESKIQAVIKASDPHASLPPVMALLPQDSYDKPGAVCYPQTAELLVGRHPIANAPGGANPAQDTNYSYGASNPPDGAVYLQGYWHLTPEAAISGERDGYLVLRYHAIAVDVVMKTQAGGAVRVDVAQDGRPIAKADAGPDLRYDAQGRSYVVVDSPRAYDLLANARFGEHELKLSPKSDGLGIYDVAFESCEVPQK